MFPVAMVESGVSLSVGGRFEQLPVVKTGISCASGEEVDCLVRGMYVWAVLCLVGEVHVVPSWYRIKRRRKGRHDGGLVSARMVNTQTMRL
jgi:hypothetical protein